MDKFPDFICIGAQRAGTTWLYKQLQQQTDVWLPPVKELHYFDRMDQQYGLELLLKNKRWRDECLRLLAKAILGLSLSDLLWAKKYFLSERNNSWYKSLFNTGSDKVCGDLTPAYSILDRESVGRIYSVMPSVKIIFIMRDPVKRAWSHAIKGLVYGKGLSIDEITEQQFIEHFESDFSRLRGDYLRTIDNWLAFYPKDQLLLGFMEDIASRPSDLIEDVCLFIGVKPDVVQKAVSEKPTNAKASGHKIPDSLELHLSRLYRDEIAALAARYNSLPAQWLEAADACIAKAEQTEAGKGL